MGHFTPINADWYTKKPDLRRCKIPSWVWKARAASTFPKGAALFCSRGNRHLTRIVTVYLLIISFPLAPQCEICIHLGGWKLPARECPGIEGVGVLSSTRSLSLRNSGYGRQAGIQFHPNRTLIAVRRCGMLRGTAHLLTVNRVNTNERRVSLDGKRLEGHPCRHR